MKTAADLNRTLLSLDRKSYPAYKSLAGQYEFDRYTLCIDHVQGDPFAAPSRLRIVMDQKTAAFPPDLFDLPHKRTALEDQINRLFYRAIGQQTGKAHGSGKSGLISISRCGQEVLDRTAVEIDGKQLTIRFEVGFPAAGRSILARELEKILFSFLPEIAERSMIFRNLDQKRIRAAVELSEDQFFLREELARRGLIAFVANGAILPRESGVSDRPLADGIPFVSPDSLRVTLELPRHGKLSGMGIPRGITLVVGGGYHGKSTLLKALERGVYDHIAGDGREFVICEGSAMKIRAEDGRSIRSTDISPFINNLPNGKDTHRFTTENASGSTSQAANVAEAIEAGAKLFLIDEDTSATNFMIRDEMMRKLIAAEQEPITPFTDLIRPIYEQLGISTILVVGSSGTYFQLADTVIQMDAYEPKDITERAKAVCGEFPRSGEAVKEVRLALDFHRCLKKGSIRREDRGVKIKTMGRDGVVINKDTIDLRYVEQLVDSEQLMTLGRVLEYAEEHLAGSQKTLSEIADQIVELIRAKGLTALAGSHRFSGSLAMPRKQEILACFNRFRQLKV